MKKYLAPVGIALAVPFLTFAQAITSVQGLAAFVISFINTILVPVLFAIAFIVFLFGIFQYFILGRGNEEAAAQGRALMLWGLIGFFVMVAVWGLVNILIGTFNLNQAIPNYPGASSQPGIPQ